MEGRREGGGGEEGRGREKGGREGIKEGQKRREERRSNLSGSFSPNTWFPTLLEFEGDLVEGQVWCVFSTGRPWR